MKFHSDVEVTDYDELVQKFTEQCPRRTLLADPLCDVMPDGRTTGRLRSYIHHTLSMYHIFVDTNDDLTLNKSE